MRVLGKVHIERAEVIEKLKHGEGILLLVFFFFKDSDDKLLTPAVSSPLINVNPDGPTLLVTVICSTMPPSARTTKFGLNIVNDSQPLVHDYHYQQRALY